MMSGIGLMGIQTFRWYQTGFGYLDLNQTGRVFVPGACLFLIGISVILNGFCLSVFSLATRKSDIRKPDAC
jgi:hypothetical protein